MSTHKEYALIAILATMAVVGVVPVFAQYESLPSPQSPQPLPSAATPLPVTISVDKSVYDHNSIVVVSGHVQNPYPGQQITIRVSDSTGNIVQVSQLVVGNNGDFTTNLNTASPLWTNSGVYTVVAQYGNQQGTSSKAQFTISGGGVTCESNQLAAKLDDKVYCIQYSISSGTVLSGTLSSASKSLIINIQADDNGQITLSIPRNVLDSKNGINDQSFVVLVDGEEKNGFTEITSSDARTITIPFEFGNGQIEIIGTQIVPEFGPIAALVLAIAIISIIAVSAKTGLRFMPKY